VSVNFAGIGADSELIDMIRGEYSIADNVLRALDTVPAHEVAAAVDLGSTCERWLQHRGAISGGTIGSGGTGRIGIGGVSKDALELDVLERREEAERKARLDAAFGNDNAVDEVEILVLEAEESTPLRTKFG
jgi:hypothetical protein